MRQFTFIGPGIVVLAAASAAILAAPLVVRSANHAQTTADIVRASRVLAGTDAPPGGVGETTQLVAAREAVIEPILEQLNRAHRAIAKVVEPSVVHVSTLTTMRRRAFTAPYASSGSGWVWDQDGHIVTNAHVVESSDRVQVQFFDG